MMGASGGFKFTYGVYGVNNGLGFKLSPRKIRGDYIGVEIVEKGDKGGDVLGGFAANKIFNVRNSFSPVDYGRSKAVSNLSHVDPSGLFLAFSRNGCIELLLLSSNCFLYSLPTALSSLAFALATFLTDAD